MNTRPNFNDLKSYQKFSKYYWYREELKQICRSIGIDYSGTKLELESNIKEYFKGNIVRKKESHIKLKVMTGELTLNTKLLECGFCFNQKFRDFFIKQTGFNNFKFNADMVASAKKVKQDNDVSFTLQDMLDIYYGKKEYAKYDNSSCEWNKFFKDFCADKNNSIYSNKLKIASILWNEVRSGTGEKIYTKNLINEHLDKIREYQ